MRAVVLLVFALAAFTVQAAFSAEQLAFTAYLLGGDEPTVKDATWMTDTNLYVGVIDDGTSRNGFAQYLCQAAQERGVPTARKFRSRKLRSSSSPLPNTPKPRHAGFFYAWRKHGLA